MDIYPCHNPYFSRWFSAIIFSGGNKYVIRSHNPYFSRWFSAIRISEYGVERRDKVTILILVDGFLQYNYDERLRRPKK